MNSVNVAGRLVADPMTIGRGGDNPGARIKIAARDLRSSDTHFIPCVAWGQSARYILKYLHKGDFVLCSGRITSRDATTQDGRKTSYVDVVIDTVRSGPRSGSPEGDGAYGYEQQGDYARKGAYGQSGSGGKGGYRGGAAFDGDRATQTLTGELANLDESFPDTVELNLNDAVSMSTLEPDAPAAADEAEGRPELQWSDDLDD